MISAVFFTQSHTHVYTLRHMQTCWSGLTSQNRRNSHWKNPTCANTAACFQLYSALGSTGIYTQRLFLALTTQGIKEVQAHVTIKWFDFNVTIHLWSRGEKTASGTFEEGRENPEARQRKATNTFILFFSEENQWLPLFFSITLKYSDVSSA